MVSKYCVFGLMIGFTMLNLYLIKSHWHNGTLPSTMPVPVSAAPVNPVLVRSKSGDKVRKNKLILLWTGSWSERTKPVNGWDITNETLKECPFKCDFTDNKDLLNFTDALVYHGVNFAGNDGKLPTLPARTKETWDQIWTFHRIESPDYFVHDMSKILNSKFNWTSTYRIDSDVPYVYGRFYKSFEPDLSIPTEDSISNKSLVGWMNSHCKTKSYREVLVDKLKQLIPVDIFGRCAPSGHLNCTRPDCYKNFSKKYKFWLSFENSLCQDYVTEKFYTPLLVGMVPVLYAHESVTRIIPNGSYINVADFSTTKDLANYLKFLDENPKEYLKYFEWRKYLRVSRDNQYWCAFCTKLYSHSVTIRKSYPSIHEWYYHNSTGASQCDDPSGPLFD